MICAGAASAVWLAVLLLGSPPVIDGVDVTGWTPKQLWAKSDEYFHEGDYLKSVHILRREVEIDPGDVEAYGVAAWLIWSLGDEPAARQWLITACENNPDGWEAPAELGSHLFERVGDPFLALPWLKKAYAVPGHPGTLSRTYAHCLIDAEEPWRAAALWAVLGRNGEAPPAVAQNNRRRALRSALRSDLQARGGGVVEGEANSAEAAVVVSEQFGRAGRDGKPNQRTVWLAEPGSPRTVARVTMAPRRVGNKTTWQWRTMVTDLNGDGRLDNDPVLLDSDDDGIAESIPPLSELVARRQAGSAALRRLSAPDRYELEVDGRGWFRPTVPLVADGVVSFTPSFVVACDQGSLALRAELRETSRLISRWLGDQPLPLGVYAGNEGTGPTARLVLRGGEVPAGRYVVALELTREGLVVDRKVSPAWVVESDGHTLRIGQPRPEDEGVWEREAGPAEPPVGAGPPAAPKPPAGRAPIAM